MSLAALMTFTVAFALAAASPGPAVAALVARALGSGFRATLPFVIGLTIGDLVWLTVATLGLAAIASAFHEVFLVIKYLGCAYLLWLAWQMWTARPEAEAVAARPAERSWRVAAAALALSLGNPKTMVFYLAVLPAFVDMRALDAAVFAELAGVIAVVMLLVMGSYAAVAARARRLFASPRARRIINRTSGTAMAGAAAAIAAN